MGSILRTKGGFVIDRPGNVLFIPVKSDGTLDYANAIRNTAVINTITVTNSKTKTEIPDGNNFYPAGDRVTAITGTVAIDFSTVDPAIWAMCSGTTLKENTTDEMIKLYDYQKIGADGSITLAETYKTGGFIQVIGSDGTIYENASAAEPAAAGEFKVDTTTGTKIKFYTDDVGKDVAISMMTTTSTTSFAQGRTAMKYHKIIIDTEYSTLNDTEKLPVNVVISQASVTGDMADALQKDPSATKTLTFNMYAPLPGEEPYSIKFKTDNE